VPKSSGLKVCLIPEFFSVSLISPKKCQKLS
jgi:hypothetical protein